MDARASTTFPIRLPRAPFRRPLGFLFAVLWLAHAARAQTPAWVWATQETGSDFLSVLDVATDYRGNLFVAFHASGTMSIGTNELPHRGGSDAIVAKYNAAGQVLWARSFGGTNSDYITALDVDGTGNVYMAGTFDGRAAFGSFELVSVTGNDLFLVKLDPDGSVLWATNAPCRPSLDRSGLAVDGAGNVVVAGSFSERARIGDSSLTSYGDNDALVAKFDRHGRALWATNAGGVRYDASYGVALDPSGNVFWSGHYMSNAWLGANHLIARNSHELFLAKCSPAGQVLWARTYPGTDWAGFPALEADGNGNFYLAINFAIQIELGPFVLANYNVPGRNSDLALAKFSGGGDVLWLAHGGGLGSDSVQDLAVDSAGHAYLAGYFRVTPISGPAIFGTNVVRDSGLYVAKCSADGQVMWCKAGPSPDGLRAMAVDSAANVYVGGYFAGVARFGSIALTNTSIHYQGFLAQLSSGADPPTIVWQTTSQVHAVGDSATFSVKAVGAAPLHYQWWKGIGTNLVPVEGATNDSLTLLNVQRADSGAYFVIVSNLFGNATNEIARLIVLARSGPGSPDPTFNVTLDGAPNINVVTIAEQPDGKILIGGEFTRVNGIARTNMARLWPDGRVDPSFNVVLEHLYPPVVRAIAVQADGKIIVGGYFTNVNGIARGNLARLNPDGSLDAGVNAPLDTFAEAMAVALQSDGKILAAGYNYDAHGAHGVLIRFNRDGSLDPHYSLIARGGYGIVAMAVQGDNKALIAGEFQSVNGVGPASVSRVNPDGMVDLSFHPAEGTATELYGLALQPDEKILLSGYVPNTIVRLNPNGTLDSSFTVTPITWSDWRALTVQPDGKILLGGSAGGEPLSGIGRLNPNGSMDLSFDPGTGVEGGLVSVIHVQADDQILVGGYFDRFDGIPYSGLVRLNGGPHTPPIFVQRRISRPEVELLAAPPPGTSVYAIEDHPPTGWLVTNISHSGVFDAATGKVKFGPFFDADVRTLGYSVVPPLGAQGIFIFSGVASADGVNGSIGGEQWWVIPGFHPADRNPADWQMAIAEVTAYGAAWRRGFDWMTPPNPIPIDYVTRAGFFWGNGECYMADAHVTNAPLWWVICVSPVSADVQSPQMSNVPNAQRQLPNVFVPGQPLLVTVSVSPASAKAYAIEEQPPADWTVTGISDGGEFDAVHQTVKWGPFFDSLPRQFHYEVTPPATMSGVARFFGAASCDGASVVVTGASELRAGYRLTLEFQHGTAELELRLAGEVGRTCVIETSTDLAAWEVLTTLVIPKGGITLPLSLAPGEPNRFYRTNLFP